MHMYVSMCVCMCPSDCVRSVCAVCVLRTCVCPRVCACVHVCVCVVCVHVSMCVRVCMCPCECMWCHCAWVGCRHCGCYQRLTIGVQRFAIRWASGECDGERDILKDQE